MNANAMTQLKIHNARCSYNTDPSQRHPN